MLLKRKSVKMFVYSIEMFMYSMQWFLHKTILWSFYLALCLLFLIYAPFLLDIQPASYNIPFPELTGALKSNDLLSRAEHLFPGQIRGPESIAVWKGDIFTALADGRIIRIRGDKFTTVADVSECNLEDAWEIKKCGRPLAVKFDSKGYLYVIDPFFGLKRLNITSEKVKIETIFNPKMKINGKEAKFLDDFVIVEGKSEDEGNVYYMTDASTRWDMEGAFFVMLENRPTGRVIRFDERTNTTTVALDNLHFPNGIELNDKKDIIYLAELCKRRILKYHINGVNNGKVEVLLDKLPGEPDNIRRSSDTERETYWVALFGARTEKSKELMDKFADKPLLRKGLIRLFHLISVICDYIGDKLNFIFLRELSEQIKILPFMQKSSFSHGFAAEFDTHGKIVRTVQSPTGVTKHLSEVHDVREGEDRVLYLGSFMNDYVGRLVLT